MTVGWSRTRPLGTTRENGANAIAKVSPERDLFAATSDRSSRAIGGWWREERRLLSVGSVVVLISQPFGVVRLLG